MALGSTITQVTDSGLKPGITFPNFVSTGIATATNFKTGTSNLHNVGLEVAGINVLGGDTTIGTGATVWRDGGALFSGIVSATSFYGDISNATGAAAGLGTALSQTQTDPLNKIYYTDSVLSIGATITIDTPSSASAAYTQYTDIVADGADIIIADGDDFVPDILGISTDTIPSYSGSGGRVRAGKFTNTGANGAPTAPNGWIVTGVSTATTFKGAIDASTGAFSSNVTISGNLGVAGTITYEDVARVDATGISTFREGYKVGPLAGIALTAYKDGSIRTSGIITATTGSFSGTVTANSFSGDGSSLTGINTAFGNSSINSTGIITATAFVPSQGQLSHRNLIINGAMQVAQRGTTGTTSGIVTVDRWYGAHSGTNEAPTQAQHTLTSSDTGPWAKGFRKSFHITNGNQTGGAGAGDYINIQTRLEAQDFANSGWDYASTSSYITLSFWVKSSVAQNFYGYVRAIDGTSQSYPFETGSLSTNTWTKIIKTIPGNSNITIDNDTNHGFQVNITPYWGTNYTDSGTALNTWAAFASATRVPVATTTWYTTNDATFEITGVQLEVGSAATPFEHRSYADELAKCQRYFAVWPPRSGGIPAWPMYTGSNQASAHCWIPYNMRVVPTPTDKGTGTSTTTGHAYNHNGVSVSSRYANGTSPTLSCGGDTSTGSYGINMHFGTHSSGTHEADIASWNGTSPGIFLNAEL